MKTTYFLRTAWAVSFPSPLDFEEVPDNVSNLDIIVTSLVGV